MTKIPQSRARFSRVGGAQGCGLEPAILNPEPSVGKHPLNWEFRFTKPAIFQSVKTGTPTTTTATTTTTTTTTPAATTTKSFIPDERERVHQHCSRAWLAGDFGSMLLQPCSWVFLTQAAATDLSPHTFDLQLQLAQKNNQEPRRESTT